MEEILLQTVIDKLEALEKTCGNMGNTIANISDYSQDFKDVNEKIRKMQMEVRGIPEQISIPATEIQSQRIIMNGLMKQLEKPLVQETKYVHHLHKPFLCCIAMVGIVVGLIFWVGELYHDIRVINRNADYSVEKGVADYLKNREIQNLSQPKIQPVKHKSNGKNKQNMTPNPKQTTAVDDSLP